MPLSPALMLEPQSGRPAGPAPGRARLRRGKRLLSLSLLLLTAALVWHSSHRVGTGPAAGTALRGEASTSTAGGTAPAILRVGTFNIHGGKGLDNRRDLDRIASEIRTLDLVGLNEVEGPFLIERKTQVEELARRLDMPWLFAPSERRWWHYDFGNGVVTRLPVERWERIPLPRSFGKGFRNLVALEAKFSGKPLHVVVTHIDRRDDRERKAQLRFVADYFLALPEPAILMGDLNTTAGDAELRRLLESPGVVDALGRQHQENPPSHIDWILTRGLVVHEAGMGELGASDHPVVWAALELAPQAVETARY